MEKLDGEVQRIAKLRAWSETEGKRIIAAWRRSRSGQLEVDGILCWPVETFLTTLKPSIWPG